MKQDLSFISHPSVRARMALDLKRSDVVGYNLQPVKEGGLEDKRWQLRLSLIEEGLKGLGARVTWNGNKFEVSMPGKQLAIFIKKFSILLCDATLS